MTSSSLLLCITTATKDGSTTKFSVSNAGDVTLTTPDRRVSGSIDIARFLAAYASLLEVIGTTSPSHIRVKGTSSHECHHVQIKLRHVTRRLCVYGQPTTDVGKYTDRNDREPRHVPQHEIAALFGACRENGWTY
ncbi:hypothetical protein SDRG_06765 [Saprolegnia diclina VS20]|uniref:Uncharacterized protein n=1 Tax=Saprolegnia diclina (strain VS20) TaxID=1156394 RepID=T0S0A3_SAPDV|nr:hypothetical protein SDRG_06765 [Saprolegnia diclina VS20]EQC36027.1 hypothetical protein SDRG_06765 [Saprolegnia diclina VS20]|eukprot:XP_008610789.1 hypothetical protein SDRG_06765 [Saprolegnia diclina VS20]